jgi:hypothetical protein
LRLLKTLALLPTVTPQVPFPAVADGAAEPILVVRRGGSHAAFSRVIEA